MYTLLFAKFIISQITTGISSVGRARIRVGHRAEDELGECHPGEASGAEGERADGHAGRGEEESAAGERHGQPAPQQDQRLQEADRGDGGDRQPQSGQVPPGAARAGGGGRSRRPGGGAARQAARLQAIERLIGPRVVAAAAAAAARRICREAIGELCGADKLECLENGMC